MPQLFSALRLLDRHTVMKSALTIIGHRSGARCPVDLIGPLLVLVVPFVALLLGVWLIIVMISRGGGR